VLIDKTFEGDDQTLKQALTQADPMILRTLLYQFSGDESTLDLPTQEIPVYGGMMATTILDPQYEETLRHKAFEFFKKWRDEKRQMPPAPDKDKLNQLMVICGGAPLNDLECQVGIEELAFEQYPREVKWDKTPPKSALENFEVLVIGSGVGGIASGVYLERMGIRYTVVTKDGGVGGTWYRNTYPDSRVDVTSHHYSFSFETPYPWKHYFAPCTEIREYMEFVAKKHGVMEHIRFHTEVLAATWDEAASVWNVRIRKSNGQEETCSFNAIISSVGLFNEAKMPDYEGIEDFQGKMFHTSNWDHSYDYDDKRIGVIGTGPSTMQLVPKVAKTALQLTVFQRTPGWIVPMPGYRDPISPEVRWLLDHIPYYQNWYRFRQYAGHMNTHHESLTIDPNWKQPGSINATNQGMREFLLGYLKEKLAGRPDLIEKTTPAYPPLAKRPIMDNGWFDALLRNNVELVTTAIDKITPKGVKTNDGKEYEFDLLVIGAGFATNKFLYPMKITGKGGAVLEDIWSKDGARAYLGVTVPHFPNLFCLYGPNSNPKAGGIFLWEELQARYSISCIKHLIENGARSIEVHQEVHDDYNKRMDDALKDQIWMDQGQKSYFRNDFNRVDVNMPWVPKVMFQWILKPNFNEFFLK